MPYRTLQTAVFFLLVASLACIPERDTREPCVVLEPVSCMQFFRAKEQLQNFLVATDRIYSGAEPSTKDDFEAIACLGVRTIVSVDGIRPDIEAAAEQGIQYVHIPIGYDGVNEKAQRSITRLVRESETPIYIHCHHGRHRGPAAAAIACQVDSDFGSDQAIALLKRAGTNPAYTGLYRDVANFDTPSLDANLPELVSIADVPSLAARMAEIDRIVDKLEQAHEQGRERRRDDFEEDVLLLQQALRESTRMLQESPDEAGAKLVASMRESESTVADLNSHDFNATMSKLKKQCVECHRRFRD